MNGSHYQPLQLTNKLTDVSFLSKQAFSGTGGFGVSEDKKTIVKMAYIYTQEGRLDKAVAEYKKLILLDPADPSAYQLLGEVYAKKGSIQESFDAYLSAGEAFSKQGPPEKASEVYRKAAQLDEGGLSPASRKRWDSIRLQVEAETALEKEDVAGAIGLYTRLVEASPDNYETYQRLGELHARLGENQAAAKNYSELAGLFYRNKLVKKATPLFQKVLELDPKNLDARIALGEIYAKEGSESEAKKEFLAIADAMLAEGNLEKAQAYAQKAVLLKSIEAHYHLGQVHYHRGLWDDAAVEFEKLVKFKVNHVGALNHLGDIQLKRKKLDESQALYARVLKVEAQNAWALTGSAGVLEARGKSAEAAAAYLVAAKAYGESGNRAKAYECESRVRALDPVLAAANLAPEPAPVAEADDDIDPEMVEAVKTQPEPLPALKSLPVLPAALEPAPAVLPVLPVSEERRTMLSLAAGCMQAGSADEAIEIYQRLLEEFPGDKEVSALLQKAYGVITQQSAAAKAPAPVVAPPVLKSLPPLPGITFKPIFDSPSTSASTAASKPVEFLPTPALPKLPVVEKVAVPLPAPPPPPLAEKPAAPPPAPVVEKAAVPPPVAAEKPAVPPAAPQSTDGKQSRGGKSRVSYI